MTSPTQRSLAVLRKEGYTCQIVEHWNPFAHIRQDLFGFIDIVAIKKGESGVLGIQTTSQTNSMKRLHKIIENPITKIWLESGNRIEIHGWAKMGARGKRKEWKINRRVIAGISETE
jgi:hypothetical protein